MSLELTFLGQTPSGHVCPLLPCFSLLLIIPLLVVLGLFPTHHPSLLSPLLLPWPIPPGYVSPDRALCVTSTLLPLLTPLFRLKWYFEPSTSFSSTASTTRRFGDASLISLVCLCLHHISVKLFFDTLGRTHYSKHIIMDLVKGCCRLLLNYFQLSSLKGFLSILESTWLSTVARHVNYRNCNWLHTITAEGTFFTGINNDAVGTEIRKLL